METERCHRIAKLLAAKANEKAKNYVYQEASTKAFNLYMKVADKLKCDLCNTKETEPPSNNTASISIDHPSNWLYKKDKNGKLHAICNTCMENWQCVSCDDHSKGELQINEQASVHYDFKCKYEENATIDEMIQMMIKDKQKWNLDTEHHQYAS